MLFIKRREILAYYVSLRCNAERREDNVNRDRQHQTDDGNHMAVFPRGEVDCADILDDILICRRTVLVQITWNAVMIFGVYAGSLRNMNTPRMVQSTGRETNWLMELRKVVIPEAFMTKGAMMIETQPAMVP